jgi:hypothetical protein
MKTNEQAFFSGLAILSKTPSVPDLDTHSWQTKIHMTANWVTSTSGQRCQDRQHCQNIWGGKLIKVFNPIFCFEITRYHNVMEILIAAG